jgi:hypothetical protein
MNYVPAVAVTAVLFVSCTPALAGGEFYGRIADTASVRSCEGKLIEQIHEGGNMHGFDGMLLLACMQSKTEASWVLLSGTSCYDGADNPTKCAGRLVKAIPRFIVDENFWQAKETPSAAYPMLYNLVKYGIGEKCKIVDQKYQTHGSHNQSGVDRYWQCDNISTQDGAQASLIFYDVISIG